MRRRHLAAIAVGVATTMTAVPVMAADPEPPLVNEELVVAEVDASGLPVDATLYSRVVARDFPEATVRDPSSTRDVQFLDRRGAPPTEGGAVLIEVGGAGQTSVTTRAAFDKPLPVALHAEYRQGPDVMAPDSVESTDGEMQVVYTVTNTTAEQQRIRYRDAAGRWTVTATPVFAPFVGTLVATLPDGMTLLAAPNAIRGTTEDGRTRLTWNLVLYPPMGDYQQSVRMLVHGEPLAIPGLALQVVPVQSSQSPTLGFSTDLLAASVDGNAELAEGMVQLDTSATALADGAAELAQGLRQVGEGTSALTRSVDAELVPGAREIADGADELASGQRKAAKGTKDLAKGQTKAAKGTSKAYKGARSLEEGAAELSDGLLSLSEGLQELVEPDGLPAARESSLQLADAVLQLRNVIGTPSDPPISLPPSPNTTLIQAVRASTKVAGVTLAGAHKVAGNLEEIAVALGGLAITSGQAAASAGSARAAIELVHQQACVDAVVLDPAQCAALQQAAEDAGQAAQSSGQVGLGVGEQAARTKTQAVAVGAITLALKGIVYALALVEKALTQVSLALVSGNTQSPGVYEGLIQLTAGLSATIDGLIALSDGAGKSTEGADELTAGAEDLTDGLDDLSEGADELAEGTDDLARGAEDLADGGDALADGTQAQAQGTAAVGDALGQLDEGVDSATSGAAQLARGADQLHREGTSEVLAGIVDASKDPARAQAYLAASEDRAGDALPYGAPDGAAGRVAYIYTLQGSDTGDGTASTVAGWALLLVIAVAAGSVAWRRLHPVDGAAGEASGTPPPTPASQPEPFAPAEPTPEDTWPFGP